MSGQSIINHQLTMNINAIDDDHASDEEEDLDEEDLIVQAAVTAAISATLVVIDYSQTYYNKTPYHDSALSGAAWVCKLLRGHPKRIRKELGVHKYVFQALIVALQDAGYTQSKFVTLEEQLAIFLYTCVTGLSCSHVNAFNKQQRLLPSMLFICYHYHNC